MKLSALIFLLLMIAQPLWGQKKKNRGSMETESETYNLDVLSIRFKVSIIDADEKKPMTAFTEVKDVQKSNIVYANASVQSFETIFLKNRIYTMRFSAPKYNDTLITLNFFKDTITNLTVELQAKRVPFEIDISDMETGEGLPFGVTLTNKNRNEVINLDPKDGNKGKYKVRLREDDEYEVEVKNPKEYIFYANTINPKKKQKLQAKLHTLTVGAKIPLYNITFEYNSAELNDNSKRELDRITKMLNDNPTARIEIAAHTDSKGTLKYNMELSQRRAKAVHDYLVAKKIPSKRFVSKGYGPTRPIASNDTEEGRAMNRRFELIVLSI
ncbi:OmpA family protein [Raineya orbicola]|jgi:outer membrane protein OmpA-like peptidoglycan-associated protein|uniref:OmpA family n=1 Tax=Raineya orbicola TaxID=2016530 RepID=A0A2N3I977_9BACT|nr:OmpA family protein [Raineya orbicola]PKQ66857.1 OmpA family [Raineya orbicola]